MSYSLLVIRVNAGIKKKCTTEQEIVGAMSLNVYVKNSK